MNLDNNETDLKEDNIDEKQTIHEYEDLVESKLENVKKTNVVLDANGEVTTKNITESEIVVDNDNNIKVKNKKIIIFITSLIITIILIYVLFSVFFTNRFNLGSMVNGVKASGKTVETMTEIILSQSENYKLEIIGRDGTTEVVTGPEISLNYNLGDELNSFVENQNPFTWVSGLFKQTDYSLKQDVSYDETKLNEVIANLVYLDSSKIIEPQDATFKYENNEYIIVEEVLGNKISKDTLYQEVVQAIVNGESTIDLEEKDCYVKPKYYSTSKEVLDAKDTLNKYIGTEVTYTLGKNVEIVDASLVNTWLEVDKNMQVIVNEEKVKDYVQQLASQFNTYGDSRDFKTSIGTTKQIKGGDYGWIVNKGSETKELISNIKAGKILSREPIFSQRANEFGVNDIGDTYVEINITKQHIWFYKNGTLVTDGDIVTGNISKNYNTRVGTFALKYKQRDQVLRGEDYAVPVSYWMPFDGGIGLHDADWRSSFGGDLYKTSGSHGCVNMPYNVAEKIYKNIEAGTAIIVYY